MSDVRSRPVTAIAPAAAYAAHANDILLPLPQMDAAVTESLSLDVETTATH